MNPQDIGLLIWSLVRFRHVPERYWQQRLLAVTQQEMQSLMTGAYVICCQV